MNNQRRKQIREVITKINECSSNLSSVKEYEDDAIASSPENLTNSENYKNSEDCSEKLGEVIYELDSIVTTLEEIT